MILTTLEFFNKYGKPISTINNPNIDLMISNLLTVEELDYLLELYKKVRPQACLEIGQQFGGTLYYLIKLADKDCKIVGIDICYDNIQKVGFKSLDINTENLTFINGHSDSDDTYEQVCDISTEYNFIFIDGDHSYEGVKRDYERYGGLVTNGVIVIHDVHLGQDQIEQKWGVYYYWQELSKELSGQANIATNTFIASSIKPVSSCGLGIIYKGSAIKLLEEIYQQ